MKKSIAKKIITLLVTIFMTVSLFAPGVLLAVNDEFDNPDDSYVSQNEAYTDLLNETLSDAPDPVGTAYILMDSQSGATLMGRGLDTQIEPAACSKILTVLLALENLDTEEIITINPAMYAFLPEAYAGEAALGLTDGEEIKVIDLIYAIMLTSANDACLALAITISGSEQLFCDLMNSRARELGCTNTNFTSCYGASSASNVSTVHDMALIMKACSENSVFCDISRTFQHTIEPTNIYSDSRVLSNGSRFISTQEYSYDYYTGGKTGYADNVGYSIVSSAAKNGRRLIAVIVGSTSSDRRYQDIISLFEFGFSAYTTIQIEPSEFTPLYNNTIDQINSKLINTELGVVDSSMEFSEYLTTTTARTMLGSSNLIELTGVIINTSEDDQYFNIPICKSYNDGKNYIVGVLHLHIATKDKIIEKNPERSTVWGGFRNVLITIIAAVAILLILTYALYLFRRMLRKRSDDEYRRRNRML